jgi:hypothetical protein
MSSTSIAELEWRDASGQNLVGSGTPFASSEHSSPWQPAYAHDNDTATAWDSGTYPPSFIGYDFGEGADVEIESISMYGRYRNAYRLPCWFEIQHSEDNVSWTTKWEVLTAVAGPLGPYVYTYPGILTPNDTAPHRWWMVKGEYPGNARTSFGEIELREVIGGADVTTPGMTGFHAPLGYISWTYQLAIDNNLGSAFTTNENDKHAYLAFDFGAGNEKTIRELAFYPRQYLTESPKRLEVWYSDDGEHWFPKFGEDCNFPSQEWQYFQYTETESPPRIFLGGTEIVGLNRGALPVVEVYKGSEKLWQT